MLKIKHLTLFKPKNWKKGGNFYQSCKKNLCSIFVLQPSVAVKRDFNQNWVLCRMQVI